MLLSLVNFPHVLKAVLGVPAKCPGSPSSLLLHTCPFCCLLRHQTLTSCSALSQDQYWPGRGWGLHKYLLLTSRLLSSCSSDPGPHPPPISSVTSQWHFTLITTSFLKFFPPQFLNHCCSLVFFLDLESSFSASFPFHCPLTVDIYWWTPEHRFSFLFFPAIIALDSSGSGKLIPPQLPRVELVD